MLRVGDRYCSFFSHSSPTFAHFPLPLPLAEFVCHTSALLGLSYRVLLYLLSSVQFISVTRSCLTPCDPMNCSTPGLPVHHQLPEFTQTHVHRVGDVYSSTHSILLPRFAPGCLLTPKFFPGDLMSSHPG